MELIVKLREIDLKKPENRLNESVELPNSLEKETKICVIAGGDLATRAKAGQADLVIGREDLTSWERTRRLPVSSHPSMTSSSPKHP